MKGRALTDEHKRAIIERVYTAWWAQPEQRLGQLVFNASAEAGFDPFYIEDEALAEACERFAFDSRNAREVTMDALAAEEAKKK